jgi:hypothetical protein
VMVRAGNVGRRLIGPELLGVFFPSGSRVLGFMTGTAAIRAWYLARM